MNLGITHSKSILLSPPQEHTGRHSRGVGKGTEARNRKTSGAGFLALLSLQVAVGQLPGKGEYTARLVAMDLLCAEMYMCLVI